MVKYNLIYKKEKKKRDRRSGTHLLPELMIVNGFMKWTIKDFKLSLFAINSNF